MVKQKLFFLLIIAIIISSCFGKKKNIASQLPKLVLTETDTTLVPFGKPQPDLKEYFLLECNGTDTQSIHLATEKFAAKHLMEDLKKYPNYINFLMMFYCRSSEVNESKLLSCSLGSRYKIFLYNKNRFVAAYDYQGTKLIYKDY